MKNLFIAALAVISLAACHRAPKFEVRGNVSGAEGKTLYLEASTLEGVVPLDSVKLKGEGAFAFRQGRPQSPEFYRLRIEKQAINFSIDSTETVTIHAPYAGFAAGYTVEGSPNSAKIKELALMQLELQAGADKLAAAMRARAIGADGYQDSLASLIKAYKDEVKRKYIFPAPNTAAAYFALFQKVDGYLIFDPLNSRDDIKCFAAVATSLNNSFPHAMRTKNLYNIVIKGMRNTRAPRRKVLELPAEAVAEAGIIDISLRDLQGDTRKLTELKGKAVLLDFTVYQSAVSPGHNVMLAGLYEKYAARGLEIYQVSLDADEHYWKTIAANLPWICVRDANGIYSNLAALYNVQNLPCIFLVNRDNELSARGEAVKDLEAAVQALL